MPALYVCVYREPARCAGEASKTPERFQLCIIVCMSLKVNKSVCRHIIAGQLGAALERKEARAFDVHFEQS